MVIILHYALCTTTRSVKSAANIFACINEIQFKFEPDRQVIASMKAGTLYEIIRAGLICVLTETNYSRRKTKEFSVS